MTLTARQIRALRPPRPEVRSDRALGVELEQEREPDGRILPSATVFLAGAECPFTCVFCDLWRYTLEGPTPAGALVRQLAGALAELPSEHRGGRIKLYNASNFFDPRAVPPGDLPRIAELVAPFERVVVECHARLVGDACRRFGELLGGRLELALGLETAHPETLVRLEKGMTLDDFAAAAERLAGWAIPWRAFVLVGVPYLAPEEGRKWSARSVHHALAHGAERVTLIPVRGGNGALEELAAAGEWSQPRIEELEDVIERAWSGAEGRVAVDGWDLEALPGCPACSEARRSRLEQIGRLGRIPKRVTCDVCAAT